MQIQNVSAASKQWLKGLSRAFAPLRGRGFLIDGLLQDSIMKPGNSAAPSAKTPVKSGNEPPIGLFVNRLRELLNAESEVKRRQLEQQVLALAVPLRDAGVFDLVRIANEPLAAMVADHLSGQELNRTAMEF